MSMTLNENLLLSLYTSIKKAILINTDNVVNTYSENAASSSLLSQKEYISWFNVGENKRTLTILCINYFLIVLKNEC